MSGEGNPLIPVLLGVTGAVAVTALAALGLIPVGVGTALYGYYIACSSILICIGVMEIASGFRSVR